MKFPPLKIGQPVRITWLDCKSALGWTYDQSTQRKLGRIFSLGYAVQENEESITITTSIGENGASLDDLSIPVQCVESIEVIGNNKCVTPEVLEEKNG